MLDAAILQQTRAGLCRADLSAGQASLGVRGPSDARLRRPVRRVAQPRLEGRAFDWGASLDIAAYTDWAIVVAQ